MISCDEVDRLKQEAELHGYSTHIAVVLSLVLSLAAVVIMSKKHLTSLCVDAAAFAVPIPITFVFAAVVFGL